ncbi:MAG: PqqD family protein [Thermomicrobiales bacterium]
MIEARIVRIALGLQEAGKHMGTEQDFELTWANRPVPAARAIEHFSASEVGDGEVVLFDNERLTYHTLNKPAFAVWQLCDGVRTSREISGALAQSGTHVPVEAVELAVAELGESGLVESDVPSADARLTRRRVVKLAAAGALGAAVMPAVSSITAPIAAIGQTCSGCNSPEVCCPATAGNINLRGLCGYPNGVVTTDPTQCCSGNVGGNPRSCNGNDG